MAEFQAMVARLNGIFDEKAALLASLGQPHEASPANLVGHISDHRAHHRARPAAAAMVNEISCHPTMSIMVPRDCC